MLIQHSDYLIVLISGLKHITPRLKKDVVSCKSLQVFGDRKLNMCSYKDQLQPNALLTQRDLKTKVKFFYSFMVGILVDLV